MFRIATWNMDHWKRSAKQHAAGWRYLREVIKPDIALVQEAVPSPELGAIYREIGNGRLFGSAVVSYGPRIEQVHKVVTRYSKREFELDQVWPGSVVIAKVSPPNADPIVVISVYGLIDTYAQTTLLRQVADLIPLFDSVPEGKMQAVLAGDLNIHTQTRTTVERRRAKGILGAIESLGLVNLLELTKGDRAPLPNCSCAESGHCYHVETHRHGRLRADRLGANNDYVFASPSLAVRGRVKIEVHNNASAWDLSDHCPIVAAFDLVRTAPLPPNGTIVTATESIGADQAADREPANVTGPLETRRVAVLNHVQTTVRGVAVEPITIQPVDPAVVAQTNRDWPAQRVISGTRDR